MIEIKGGCSGDIYLEVISMTGQVRYAAKPNFTDKLTDAGTISYTLDLSSYAQGIYQLRLRCGDKVVSQLLSVTRN